MNGHDHWNSFEKTGNINYYLRYRGIPEHSAADEEKSHEPYPSFNKP